MEKDREDVVGAEAEVDLLAPPDVWAGYMKYIGFLEDKSRKGKKKKAKVKTKKKKEKGRRWNADQ